MNEAKFLRKYIKNLFRFSGEVGFFFRVDRYIKRIKSEMLAIFELKAEGIKLKF